MTVALPFRGFRPERPYPVTGLTTARWITEVTLDTVPLDQLWLTQEQVGIAALYGLTDTYSADFYPHVVAWDGQLYLEDGHHRVIRHQLSSRAPTVTARVLRIEQP